jgi:hypothetical protein
VSRHRPGRARRRRCVGERSPAALAELHRHLGRCWRDRCCRPLLQSADAARHRPEREHWSRNGGGPSLVKSKTTGPTAGPGALLCGAHAMSGVRRQHGRSSGIFSDSRWSNATFSLASPCQPFDLLAETTVIVAQKAAREGALSTKDTVWLALLDTYRTLCIAPSKEIRTTSRIPFTSSRPRTPQCGSVRYPDDADATASVHAWKASFLHYRSRTRAESCRRRDKCFLDR